MFEAIRTEIFSLIANMSFGQIIVAYFVVAGALCYLASCKLRS